ncbi:hypothetical protein QJQ45_001121 [Haematococcus lacustris]|nr:hypothetical protein QJQ45_001121 [Haematococcus lacustris]
MSQHSFLGPTPAEDYDEEEVDVVDGDCDDEPLTLGVFNLMPDVTAPVPDVSRYQMMALDPSIAKAQLHSTVCPKTDATEKSLMKSTFAFFFEADLKGTYADGITVPLCYKGLLREFLVDVSEDIQDITHRLYVWVNERAADLCVLFCAYAAHARNSKAKGEDGFGLKFPPKSFVHRFNCIAHQLFLHHQSLDRQGRAVPSFVRPQFLDAKHRVWGQLWNTVDGASKLAAQAGEVSLLPKQAPVITPSALADAEPLLDTHTPVGLQNMALIYLGVHGQWPSSGVPLAEQMATMAQQMAAFQVQMQLTSLQMQVQVMQQSMLSKKE